MYNNSRDIFHPNQKVGCGIYLTPNPEIMEQYAQIQSFINIGKKVKLGLMLRVKPDKIRCSSDNLDDWILNPTTDEIRPYRILLKFC